MWQLEASYSEMIKHVQTSIKIKQDGHIKFVFQFLSLFWQQKSLLHKESNYCKENLTDSTYSFCKPSAPANCVWFCAFGLSGLG